MQSRSLGYYHSITRHSPDLKLELGCGSNKLHEDWVGVDILDESAADVVADVCSVLESTFDNSVCEIYTKHFLEHVEDLNTYLSQISRVLKIGSRAQFIVPHFSCPFYYSDPTHKAFFGLYTFNYFALKPYPMRRQVPQYNLVLPLQVESINIVFASNFILLKPLAKLVSFIINSSRTMQEIYEALLCWIIPCHELRVEVRKL